MKKIHRERALTELVDRLESRDFDQREHALFQIAVMLRRANRRAGGDDPLSATDLPREFSRILLTLEEQRTIVDRLLRLVVSRRESRASALWALSEAAPGVGWAPVLHLLKACGDQLTGEAAYQACRALRLWLESGELSGEIVQRGIAVCDLQGLSQLWIETGEMRLKRAAQDLTGSLNAAAE